MSREAALRSALLHGAVQVAIGTGKAAQWARDAEQRAIRQATEDHTSMPNNYWQERWRAEQKAQAALKLLEALS